MQRCRIVARSHASVHILTERGERMFSYVWPPARFRLSVAPLRPGVGHSPSWHEPCTHARVRVHLPRRPRAICDSLSHMRRIQAMV